MRRSHAAVRSSRRAVSIGLGLVSLGGYVRAAGRSGKHSMISPTPNGRASNRQFHEPVCPLLVFLSGRTPLLSQKRRSVSLVSTDRDLLSTKTSDVFATSVFRFSARRRCVPVSFVASDTQHTHRKMAAMTSTMMTLRVSAKAPVKASNKVRLKTRSRAPIAVWRRVHRLFAPSPFGGELRRREWTARGAMRPVATGSDGRERSLMTLVIHSPSLRGPFASSEPRRARFRRAHPEPTSLTTKFSR